MVLHLPSKLDQWVRSHGPSAARFLFVAAGGYLLALSTFTLAANVLDWHYRWAATAGFLVTLANNFFWHRRWTFRGHTERAHRQAVRFLLVSLVAFAVDLLVLIPLTAVSSSDVIAQAVALIIASPVNFLGLRFWAFRVPVAPENDVPAAITVVDDSPQRPL